MPNPKNHVIPTFLNFSSVFPLRSGSRGLCGWNIAFFFFLFVFLGPHPWLMEVPRLGVKPWPTPQPQQLGIRAASATYTSAHSHAGFLTHWARPRIEPTSSWILVGFITAEPLWELQVISNSVLSSIPHTHVGKQRVESRVSLHLRTGMWWSKNVIKTLHCFPWQDWAALKTRLCQESWSASISRRYFLPWGRGWVVQNPSHLPKYIQYLFWKISVIFYVLFFFFFLSFCLY